MAHELTIRSNGEAEAFFAGDGKNLNPAWHGLGTNVLDAPNSEAAIKLAGLHWTVSKVTAAAKVNGNYLESPDFHATVRDDNGFILGYVTDKYHAVQNWEAFDFMDGLNQDGIVKYESAGSLRGGRVVWLLARMGSIMEVAAGDAIQPYVLFSTSHDGTAAVNVMPTNVRVVCANTLRAALGRYGTGISFKHDGTVQERLAAAKDAIKLSQGSVASQFEKAQALVKTKFDKTAFQQFVDGILPEPPAEAKRPALRLKAREHIAWNFYSNPRQNLPGIERSAWAAYNAVSEFADHNGRFRSDESRFVSVMEGGADQLKQLAFDKALSMV